MRAQHDGGITCTSATDMHRSNRRPDRGAGSRRLLLTASLFAALCVLPSVAPALAAGTGAPANEAAPALTGSARDGLRLKTVKGVWSGETPLSYSYAWRRCDASGSGCEVIAGALKAS